jgi:3-deoxy-D-manno-octulosonic-acid transferase
MYLIYNVVLHLLVLAGLPAILLYLLVSGRAREGFSLRLGSRHPDSAVLEGRPVIWVNGSSVGEIGAAAGLAGRLKADFPGTGLIISTQNPRGGDVARESHGLGDVQTLLPLDLPILIKRAFREPQRPGFMILMEGEYWPNLLWTLRKMKVPAVVVNGRLSERSFRRYSLVRPLASRFFGAVEVFFMQTEEDAARVSRLGVPPGRVRVAGNLKDDRPLPEVEEGRKKWRKVLAVPGETPVLLGASLHPPEMEGLARVYLGLRREFPGLALIMAPRHLHKLPEILGGLKSLGLAPVLRSGGGSLGPGEAMVLDTMGELKDLYAAADLAFVGGTMVPRGGHNLVEGAAWGLPVYFGPSTENQAAAAGLLLNTGGGRQVSGWDELGSSLRRVLGDAGERDGMARASRRAAEDMTGALDRIYPELKEMIEKALSSH